MGSILKLAKGLPMILGNDVPLPDYPDNLYTQEAEKEILASLPQIAELDNVSLTEQQRIAMLKNKVALERAAFIAAHGDPFGEVWAPEKEVSIPDEKQAVRA